MLNDPGPYPLTDADKLLIRCIGAPKSNIAAVHFDGALLAEMVAAHREIQAKARSLGRW